MFQFEETVHDYDNPHLAQRDLAALNTRITAFWAMCEVGIGTALGFVAAPAAPIITGFFGVLCTALLCWYNDNRSGPLFRAWLVLFLVKFAMNPLAPLPAYFGFSFLAVLGLFCYRFFRNFQVAALVHGFFSLFQMGFMRVMFASVNSKIDWWNGKAAFSLNAFSNRIMAQWINNSTNMAALYVALMVGAGLAAAWMAAYLVRNIEAEKIRIDQMGLGHSLADFESKKVLKKKEKAAEKAARREARRIAKGRPPKKEKKENYKTPAKIIGVGFAFWILGASIGAKLMTAGLFWLVVFTDFVKKYMIDWVQQALDFVGALMGHTHRPDLRQTASRLPEIRLCLRAAWAIAGQRSTGFFARAEAFVPLVFAIALRDVEGGNKGLGGLEGNVN